MIGPMAKPSSPSVRFTAFAHLTITKRKKIVKKVQINKITFSKWYVNDVNEFLVD